ncbi:hypothetical protein L539_3636 [Bordetella hinzii 5132]|uniref:hypothetical protein n=1 Tax=Bordetella hinzii TaxID=103855 RepID=UPI0004596805|nr:hypothetical protein [Bordetella hinzii]KCB41436.1 hypothetical protein L539_3636 [Bordetella hinzii 5132]
MNEQNSAVQPLLTGDEIRAAVRQAHSMTAPSDTTEPGDYVMAGVRALLSKLRAPVADETQALHDHDLWFQEYGQTLGAFYNNLTIHTRAAWVAASRQYAALASAPVADERAAKLDAECNSLAHQLNASNERNGVLRAALSDCSAELFAQCGDQSRAMSYVNAARAAMAATKGESNE